MPPSIILLFTLQNQSNLDEATEKFKRISAAYARLTSVEQESDDDLDDYDPSDIFTDDLFAELFGGMPGMSSGIPFSFV